MSKRIYSITLLGLITLSLLVTILPLLTTVEATIVGRPVLYYYMTDITGDPLRISAGGNVSIYLGAVNISGAQVWLWLSKTGGAAIEPNDAFFVGPFLVSDIYAEDGKTYEFTPDKLPSPFNKEGRTYVYDVGGGWINGTLPLLVEGGVSYWLKITDVSPALGLQTPSSEVAVSTNRIVFTEVCTATPESDSTLAPLAPVTIACRATVPDAAYNITQTVGTTVYSWTTVISQTISESIPTGTWSYTGFTATINIVDLGYKRIEVTPQNYTVVVNVIRTTDSEVVGTYTYIVPYREVYLDGNLRLHSADYSNIVVLGTGTRHTVSVNWFPYKGSIDIYLGDRLLASGVALNETGGAETTITVPIDMTTGNYTFKVIDDQGVEYNFTVTVVVVPAIEVEPAEGYVGDVVTVKGYNFQDYIGSYITILFETCPVEGRYDVLYGSTGYKIVANFTVPAMNWNYNIVVPVAPGGERVILIGDATGTPITTYYGTTVNTTFTVKPKLEVVPNTIASNYTGVVSVIGTGFVPSTGYWVTVDNAFAGVVVCDECGYFEAKIPAGGFRPGLHVVALYNFATYGYLTDLITYAHFLVTEEGDIIAGKLSAINATITGIAGDVVYIKTNIGNIELKVDEVIDLIKNGVIVKIDEGVATILTEIGEVRTDLSTLIQLVQAVNATLIDVKGDVAVIKTGVGEIKVKLSELEPLIVEIKDGVVRLETAIGEVKAGVEEVKSLVESSRNAIIAEIRSGVALILVDTGVIKAKLDTLSPVISEIRDGVVRLETAIGEVKTSLDTIKQLVESSRDAVISEIKNGVATILTDTGVIKAKVDAINATIVAVGGDVVTVKTDVGTVKSDLATIKPIVASISYDVATVKTELGELSGKIDAIKGSLVVVETDVGTILATIKDVVVPGLSDIKSVVDAVRGDVSATRSDVGAVKATTSDIRDAVATIKSDVATVKSTVEPVPTLSTAIWLAVVFSLIAVILSAVVTVSVRRKIAG